MPIQNRDDAVEVETQIASIFAATPDGRTNAIRQMFVETLDFQGDSGQISLAGASANVVLPEAAERVALLDGVHVVYVPLNIEGTDRVRKAEVDAAARLIADQLVGDHLLVFTNTSVNQLHIILPKFEGARSTVRRMVVERDLPRRTAVQQVAGIYWMHRDRGLIRAALDQAFDVEPVTREFFAEYKRIFEGAMVSVAGFGEGEEESKRTFVQTLFNRLMFVYFLSRKGWLRFGENADYLNALWRDYGKGLGDGNFHRDRLRPLFFSGLNNPNSRDLTEGLRTVIGDVPFLNGGLFEDTDLDRRGGITVPDAAIRQVLTGLFDRFNFTVMESTPFDIEVAVDPEMLGKVFEELVTGRHDSGAYYTPRPVVSFMCREALKGYLEGQDTGLEAEALARFVDHHDTEGIGVAQARRVAEALAEVTVVDPACGSGAYLLGMMQELIELQVRLFNVTQDAKSLYDLKLEIIQRNLYGVDIDDFAVNIAMLRLWLSLAIDYEGETPEPLPNLDFKVVCGDSLLGPDPSSGAEVQGTLGLDDEQVRRLGQRKGEYLRASNGADKERLRTEIAKLNAAIRASLGVVADNGVVNWRVEFAEVFASGRGFDIAIANPPYISVENLSAETKEYLFNHYETCEKRTDIYIGFMERALSLINSRGFLSFIIPAAFTKQQYATKMRQKIIREHAICFLVDASSYRIFENAVVYNVVIGISNRRVEKPTRIIINHSIKDFENHTGIEFPIDQDVYALLKDSRFDTNPSIMKATKIQEKAWCNAISLGQICLVSYGARLNSQSRNVDKTHYIYDRPFEGAKRFCEGHNIQRFSVVQENWLNYQPNEHYRPVFPEVFENEKLMAINVVKEQLRFAYDNKGIYNSHTVINCVRLDFLLSARHRTAVRAIKDGSLELAKQFDYKYLLAVLNSTFITWYFRNFLSESLHFYPNDANGLPIPRATTEAQLPLIRLTDRILKAKAADSNTDTSELEEQIDWLVYDLYGLTDEETSAVVGYFWDGSLTEDEEGQALIQAMQESES